MKHLATLAVAAALLLPSVAQADPLSRLGVTIGTKQAQVGLSYAAVRTEYLDLNALLVTGKGESKENGQFARHYHLGLGTFVPIKGTNVSVGLYSVLNGSSFKRVQLGVSVKL